MVNLTLKSGYNITLTEDPANGTLTISATDTKYTIDSTLNGSSTNPIQNKVVYTALAGKQDKLTAGTGISINGNTISCTVTGGSGGTVTVDSTLSSTSTNPVQNKVIYAALAGKQNTLTIDASLSSTSANPVQNKAVNSALAGKQDKLTAGTGISISGNTISCTVSGGSSVTVDTAMSSTSTNPVQNKAVYAALSGKQDKLTISAETWTFTLSTGSTVTKKVYVQG